MAPFVRNPASNDGSGPERQQSHWYSAVGVDARRFFEAALPKVNERRVSFLTARGRYVEEIEARGRQSRWALWNEDRKKLPL